MRRRSSGLFLLIAFAAFGYALVTLPPIVADAYDKIERVNPTLALIYLGLIGAFVVAITVWFGVKTVQMWRRTRAKARPPKRTRAMTEAEMRKEVAARQNEAREYLEGVDPAQARELGERLDREKAKMEARTLEVVAFGTISSGKSSLLNALAGRDVFATDPRGGTTSMRNEFPWPEHGTVRLVDTPGLGEMHRTQRAAVAVEAARTADLILYVSDGVLRDFEFDVLRKLSTLDKRMLVVLNKADTFAARDRELLLDQMRSQLTEIVAAADFVAVQAQPGTRVRVRVTPDGTEHEERVPVEPDIGALASRMMEILNGEGERLLLANLLVRARGLVAETKGAVQAELDTQAKELVGSYMWQAGGAAALSPFPLLDIAAGLAISYKMVVDLAAVYRQKIDLDSAREMVAQAGKNLVAAAGATLATPSVASLAASSLKAIPGVGTIAGGVLQGLVQALVTLWIGRVFMRYFRSEMDDPTRVLPEIARAEWAEVTRPAELARLVQEGVRRLGAERRSDGR